MKGIDRYNNNADYFCDFYVFSANPDNHRIDLDEYYLIHGNKYVQVHDVENDMVMTKQLAPVLSKFSSQTL